MFRYVTVTIINIGNKYTTKDNNIFDKFHTFFNLSKFLLYISYTQFCFLDGKCCVKEKLYI